MEFEWLPDALSALNDQVDGYRWQLWESAKAIAQSRGRNVVTTADVQQAIEEDAQK